MLTFDDPLWEQLNCRWGNALGTSVLIRSWALESDRCTNLWQYLYEDYVDQRRLWSAGIAVLPHLTSIASKSIGTPKSFNLMFASAMLLHYLISDSGKVKKLDEVLPIGDTALKRLSVRLMKSWVKEALSEGKPLLPSLVSLPRMSREKTEDLLFIISVFDGYPSVMMLEFPEPED